MLQQASASPPQIPRPPTPPRVSPKEYLDQSDRNRPAEILTPVSSAELTTPVDRSRKKVEWSHLTHYQEHPDFSAKLSTAFLSKIAPLAPSSDRKPPRSILKSRDALIPRDPNDSSTPTPPPKYRSFAAMLESIVRQLAGEDRTSRIDAYSTLAGALKTCDNVPDIRALKDKMGLISQFIQRDISAKTPGGAADAVLVTYALALLGSLLYKPTIAEALGHEFCTFIMDHAINAFETGQKTKDVMNRLLFIVGHQSFSAKVMTVERIGKLITAMHNIESHVTGKSITMGRIAVSSRLLRQGKSSMLANTRWLEDMLDDMVSKFKDIRSLAIGFGIQAGLLLGTEGAPSRALHDIFKAEKGHDKFADFYAGRLKAMLKAKRDGEQVPQIWIVVVLFLRHKPQQIEHWEFMKPWLLIIQECLNSSDSEVKTHATRAWNRLVFAVRPDEKTGASMMNVLCTPTIKQLQRKPPARTSGEYRKVVIGCVCNLLYYAFRPGAPSAQIDRYWDAYAVQLLSLPLKAKGESASRLKDGQAGYLSDDMSLTCLIFKSLLEPTPKAWVENRANENSIMAPSEIPSLDSQWIRKNAQRLLAAMEPLIDKSFADLVESDSPVSLLWDAFCEAISAAGAKEIKVSNDTMNALAEIFGMLYRLWAQYLLRQNMNATLFQGFGYLVSSMVSRLGVLPFTEKQLSLQMPNTFDAIMTPSHRTRLDRGDMKCPLHHLIALVGRVQSNLGNKEEYIEMVKKVLTPFLDARESRRTRLDFIQEINYLLPGESLLGEHGNSSVWEVLADFAERVLATSEESRSSGPDSEHQLGLEYRCVVNVLEAGLGTSSDSTISAARSLFHALIRHAKAESGDGGVAMAVIEPLSRKLLDRRMPLPPKLSSSYCTLLLASAQYPRDRHCLDAARRRLWGSVGSVAGQRISLVDHFSLLYGLVSSSLKAAYSGLSLEECKDLVLEASAIVERCPDSHLFHALDKLQGGLSCWIRDADRKLTDRAIATRLCERTNTAIKRLPNINTPTLKKLCDLVSCGLDSRHKFVANAAIDTWNSSFGNQKSLDYPPKVMQALARLRPIAELKLPSFPDSLPVDFDSAPPAFFESQDDEQRSLTSVTSNYTKPLVNTGRKGGTPLVSPEGTSNIVDEVKQSTSRKRRFEGTPEPISRKHARGHTTPKFRHDDSQVVFAPIQSLPKSDSAMDSQLLTDRQQEVMERQKTDAAAVFQNFGSSPSLKKAKIVQKMSSPSKNVPGTSGLGRLAMSPVTPNVFDDFIESSPTPSRGNAILADSDAIEPPSSPPERIALQPRRKSPVISQDYDETSWDITVGSGGILQPKQVGFASEIHVKKPVFTDANQLRSARDAASNIPVERPTTPVQTGTDLGGSLQPSETGAEVFMDAVSTPVRLKPTKTKSKATNLDHTNESAEPWSLPNNTTPLHESRGSQGMARGLFNAAMNLPTNIRSFISPPKYNTPQHTFSSPLDEESEQRVMKQFDRPAKELAVRGSASQPTSTRAKNEISELGYSSADSTKRRRSSFMPYVAQNRHSPHTLHIEEHQESPSERDSEDSWQPSQPEEETLPGLNPLINRGLFPSTIPETPIRPGLAGIANSGVIQTTSTTGRRPLTRLSRRLALSAAKVADAQERESPQVPASDIKVRVAAKDQPPVHDVGQESLLDYDHEPENDIDVSDYSAPTSKAKGVIEVKRSSISEPSELPLENAPAAPIVDTNDAMDIASDEDEEPHPARERDSSPSQQLLRDDESSQRLLATEPGASPAPAPHLALEPMSIVDHLRAAAIDLHNATLSREEIFDLEALLMDVKRELFAAEDRGRLGRSWSRSGSGSGGGGGG